jgi:hypothetical protein
MANARLADWTEAYESQIIFLVTNFIPRRYLYRFLNVARPGITRWFSVFRIAVRESGLQIGVLPTTPRANPKVEGTTITRSAFLYQQPGNATPESLSMSGL